MYSFYDKINWGMLFVHCMEAFRISESLSWEVPLYTDHNLLVYTGATSPLCTIAAFQDIITKSALRRHIVVVKTSLSGFDVTMWLQHLVLVPQMCSDRL